MQYRGFRLTHDDAGWLATSSDVQGSGETKDEAVEDALRQRNNLREDADRENAEELEIDRLIYGPRPEDDDDDGLDDVRSRLDGK